MSTSSVAILAELEGAGCGPIEDRTPEGYLAGVWEFACEVGKLDSLRAAICAAAPKTFFGKPCVTRLYKDFAPHSFQFAIVVDARGPVVEMEGGIIFHGRLDEVAGGAPTFSVSLTPQDGWSVHT